MTRIIEINKVLFLAHAYAGKRDTAYDILVRELRRVKISAEVSNYPDVLKTCQDLNMTRVSERHVRITGDGMRYLGLLTRNKGVAVLDPNPDQKQFLLRQLENSVLLKAGLRRFFADFKIDFSGDSKVWFTTQPKAKPPDELIVELGLVQARGNRLETNASLSAIVSRIRNRQKITEDELLGRLNTQRNIGRIAEDLTVNYEKTRLGENGFPDMALEVRKISDVDQYAGYDILSFDGNAKSYEHNRLIEAKGTSADKNRIYWSKNEVSTAKKYRKTYWIYFWKNVASHQEPDLEIIQDPYEKFFTQKEGKTEPVKYETKW